MARTDACPKCGTPGVEVCSGCGKPYTEEGARLLNRKETCNDCPAGSHMVCPRCN